MSDKFNGFSQDDINKLKTKPNKENVVKKNSRPVIKRLTVENNEIKQPPTPTPFYNVNNSAIETTIYPIQEAVHFKPLTTQKNDNNANQQIVTIKEQEIETKNNVLIIENELNDNQDAASPFKGVSLKDFEYQRKLMEEHNKQKKALLYKAIEQHSEKTAAEVKKLQDIKVELTKLDTELANDVAILRKQIDSASLQFMQMQKQYENVEKLFLKAKVDLHQASERKELLTEHLCTIISHNEERKAKKLSELMEKVGISLDNN